MKTIAHLSILAIVGFSAGFLFFHHHPYWAVSELFSYLLSYMIYWGADAGDIANVVDSLGDCLSNIEISDMGDFGGGGD